MLPYSMSAWRISGLRVPSGTARTCTTREGGGYKGTSTAGHRDRSAQSRPLSAFLCLQGLATMQWVWGSDGGHKTWCPFTVP